MTSYIVASTDKKKRQDYVSDFCLNQNIDEFDITYIEKESSKNLNTIGIDEIKNLHAKIFLKPIKSDTKAVILDDAHLLTIEAQNALLKVLEEPPAQTIIILSTDTIEVFLPTIISRCQVTILSPEEHALSESETRELEEFIANLSEMRIGERLKKAEELAKDKENAIEWIGKLILAMREKMLENYSSSPNNNLTIQRFNNEGIRALQSLHTLLKTTNVNPRFAIENTLLNLV